MKQSKLESTLILAALALGSLASAPGQTTANAPASPPALGDIGYGLVGENYSEVMAGYAKAHGAPKDLHDYDFLYNQSVWRDGLYGLDADFTYDYLSGGAHGYHDDRSTAEAGATGYVLQSWGKPFLTADAGYAWQRAAGIRRKSFAYSLTGGVEFQATQRLALTPFIQYDAEPHLHNDEVPFANLPDHAFEYGAKATYRFTRQWGATVGATLDQYNRQDLSYRAGIEYHF